jgi:GH25 family lysozyme M1 (1,4-beta-N-acetylmuramidase)
VSFSVGLATTRVLIVATEALAAIVLTFSIAHAASPRSAPSRSNDLSAVLADMDEGNRENRVPVPITGSMKSDGIELVIHRLTLGRRIFRQEGGRQLDDADPSFTERARQANESGILFGAYHVLFPSRTGADDGADQARDFLSALKDRCIPGQKLILAVDWERAKCSNRQCGIPEPKYIASFIPAVRKVTGKPVLVYTSPDILNSYSDEIAPGGAIGPLLSTNPLWLASYYSAFRFNREASLNKTRMGFVFPQTDQLLPWDHWTFWQFAASEDTAGPAPSRSVSLTIQNHRIDLSWFAGSRQEFFQFYEDHAVTCDSIDLSKL